MADRTKPVITFFKVANLECQIQDLKFSKLGVVFSSKNTIKFISHAKFVSSISPLLAAASSKQAPISGTKKVKSANSGVTFNEESNEGVSNSADYATQPPEQNNFTSSIPIKQSKIHSLTDSNPILLTKLDPVTLHTFSDNCTLNEIDFFDDSLVLYMTEISKMKLLFLKIDDVLTLEQKGNPKTSESSSSVEKPSVTYAFPGSGKSSSSGIRFLGIDIPSTTNCGIVKPGANVNSKQGKVRFHVNTPFEFEKTFDLEVDTGKVKLVEEINLLGKKFESTNYEISLIYAPSVDGKQIPITLIHRKGMLNSDLLPRKVGQQRKLLLKTYGCYGMNNNIEFESSNWSLLERDWIIAYAHIRGGSELGKDWHQSATKHDKHKSTEDIIACCNFLVAEQFTHPSILCATSNSGGAGILASAINLKPSIFKAVHLSVPFLDIRGSLMNPDLPLSQSDYHEFGNPLKDSKAYDSVSSICPYTNLQSAEYPSLLITAFKDDYRTPLWNILKYTARFREVVQRPTRVKEYSEKNINVIIDEGSHLGTNDDASNMERTAIITSFYEWIVEEMSTDVEKRAKKEYFSSFMNRFKGK